MTSIPVGISPNAIAVDPTSNFDYVTNGGNNTVINGATNQTASISVGNGPNAVAVRKLTGAFQERMDNGSLVIDAGVDVQKRMACFISANLHSVDKEIPVQHARLRLLVTNLS